MLCPQVVLVALTSLLVGACGRYEVTRVYSGTPRVERFIDESAYAAFLEGAEFEARGDHAAAAVAYRRVTDEDPESIEAWTARGRMACNAKADPGVFFAEAERLDADFAPLWRARADCAEVRGERDDSAVHRAFLLEPDDVPSAVAAAGALRRRGEMAGATALLRDLSVRHPASSAVLRAAADQAEHAGDRAWKLALDEQSQALEVARRARGGSTLSDLERAILRGDHVGALERARASRLAAEDTAGLAVVLGRPELALEVVRAVLAADPSAADVRVVGVLAADLAGEVALRDRWLAEGATAAPLGPVGRSALRELAARHARTELPELDGISDRVDASATAHGVALRLRNRRLAPAAKR